MSLKHQNCLFCWYGLHIHVDGFAQDCSNSIADTLELLQSGAKPLMSCVSHPLCGTTSHLSPLW